MQHNSFIYHLHTDETQIYISSRNPFLGSSLESLIVCLAFPLVCYTQRFLKLKLLIFHSSQPTLLNDSPCSSLTVQAPAEDWKVLPDLDHAFPCSHTSQYLLMSWGSRNEILGFSRASRFLTPCVCSSSSFYLDHFYSALFAWLMPIPPGNFSLDKPEPQKGLTCTSSVGWHYPALTLIATCLTLHCDSGLHAIHPLDCGPLGEDSTSYSLFNS